MECHSGISINVSDERKKKLQKHLFAFCPRQTRQCVKVAYTPSTRILLSLTAGEFLFLEAASYLLGNRLAYHSLFWT